MSLLLSGVVAAGYGAAVVGLHRFAVHRRRLRAKNFPTLRWLDWDTLLDGLAIPSAGFGQLDTSPPEGGPPPIALKGLAQADAMGVLIRALIAGTATALHEHEVTLSGGDKRWVEMLTQFRRTPVSVLNQLAAVSPQSVGEAYLREWLTITHMSNPLNVELLVFGSKRRINEALGRFGEHASLYFVRAYASSLLGFLDAVLDDLARAVYFSQKAPFYLEAVLQMPFIDEARPALMRACQAARAPAPTGSEMRGA